MKAVDKNIIQQSYDAVPYVSDPFPDTTPEHLASVARLFGLEVEPHDKCRVLELGCASGANLIPHAQHNPKSSYLGVDLSSVQINDGLAKIKSLGLTNIELKQMSLADITPAFGKFDYIICHGVYSWVPEEVRSEILRVCRENLTPKGLAIVSYNTYPGWKFKEVLRDAMLFRGDKFEQPQQKLSNARGMINFMHEMSAEDSLMRHFLDSEITTLRNAQSAYLFHDHLEPFNAPCYFKDFISEAARHDLCYLAEAEIHTMFASNLGDKVAGPLLNEAGGDQVQLEQYMDFIKNRQFRQTILTHKERKSLINYKLGLDKVREFNFCGHFQSKEASVELDYLPHTFYTMHNANFSVSQPIEKAALLELNANFPSTLNFRELLEGAQKRLGNKLPTHGEVVARLLEQFMIRGLVKYTLFPVRAGHTIGDKPKVIPAALQAVSNKTNCLTNIWHEKVVFDLVEQHLIPLLDGAHDKQQLIDHLEELAKQGALQFSRNGKPVIDATDRLSCAVEHAENSLLNLRAKAVLMV